MCGSRHVQNIAAGRRRHILHRQRTPISRVGRGAGYLHLLRGQAQVSYLCPIGRYSPAKAPHPRPFTRSRACDASARSSAECIADVRRRPPNTGPDHRTNAGLPAYRMDVTSDATAGAPAQGTDTTAHRPAAIYSTASAAHTARFCANVCCALLGALVVLRAYGLSASRTTPPHDTHRAHQVSALRGRVDGGIPASGACTDRGSFDRLLVIIRKALPCPCGPARQHTAPAPA